MARLILAVIMFLLSLLCIYGAPAIQLWYVSIFVTEFPWVFSGTSFLILVWCFRVKKYRIAGTIIGAASLLLFISPLIGAYRISGSLNNKFEKAFGPGSSQLIYANENKPFSIWHMFAAINESQFPYTTLSYSSSDQGPVTLDYYRSRIIGKRPCLIVIHGGSWTSGDSRQLPELNNYLTTVGYNVASINYRLVPAYRSPAPVEDVRAAFTYLRKHSGELSVDTNNFILLGRSAGGQIALIAAYTLYEPGLKGVIDIYGPADMVWGYTNPANPLVLNSCKLMEDYLGGTYAQVPQNYVAGSAVESITNVTVPTLIIHGKNDPLVAYEHSIRLDNKLREHEVQHFLLSLPWATHGCDYTLKGPSGQLSVYVIERFLNHVTHSKEKL